MESDQNESGNQADEQREETLHHLAHSTDSFGALTSHLPVE
jgi:hypothetical protein